LSNIAILFCGTHRSPESGVLVYIHVQHISTFCLHQVKRCVYNCSFDTKKTYQNCWL